jgi:ferredoxin
MDSPFETLQIDPNADEAEVEQAYRRRVKETHPDQGGSAREFQAVRAAYEAIQGGYYDEAQTVETTEEGEPESEDEDRTESRVEYLNYELLADHGWSLDDEDLFEKAGNEGFDTVDHGRIIVQQNETLLEAAENRGFEWPYACRGGACANCAVAVIEGAMEMPVNHILPPEMTERGIRLSCNATPTTEDMKVIYNVKHLPDLDELRLPPRPFERAYGDD